MSNLVDNRPELTTRQIWSQRVGVTLAVLIFVGLVTWGGLSLGRSKKGPAHQVARIALLPDTPPPPPPPPPEKPKIEPRNEMKQQIDKQKIETPPEPQQIKMEGQAGEGPSPFAAGEVKNDYIGGDIGNGDRFAGYVGRVAQFIQEELIRRKVKIGSGRVLLWLATDGSVQRFEIRDAGGDTERQIRSTMVDIRRLPEGPPQDMQMPMGLEITEH